MGSRIRSVGAPRASYSLAAARLGGLVALVFLALTFLFVGTHASAQTVLRGGAQQNVYPDEFNAGCNNPYGCAHPTYRTGTQSRQPNDGPCDNPYGCGRGRETNPNPPGRDVYCQQSPGQPMYGPYHGTGTQTPCGPNFQRQQPPPPPPQSDCSSDGTCNTCPATVGDASKETSPGFQLAAVAGAAPHLGYRNDLQQVQDTPSGPGLYVGGHRITTEAESGLQTWLDRFPLRQQIFRAMTCNLHRRFDFQTPPDLQTNISIRQKSMEVADRISKGTINLKFTNAGFYLPQGWDFDYDDFQSTDGVKVYGRRLTWRSQLAGDDITPPDPNASNSVFRPSVSAGSDEKASDAITSFQQGESRLECLSGVEMLFLTGVERAVGASAFDQIHPVRGGGSDPHALIGVGAPIGTSGASISQHLILVRSQGPYQTDRQYLQDPSPTINIADMVPGDYAYISNWPSYDQKNGGAWAGENTIYMGKGFFYGLGFGDGQSVHYYSGSYLQASLAQYYRPAIRDLFGNYARPSPGQIKWTRLAAPVKNGDMGEAGPFVSGGATTAFDQ